MSQSNYEVTCICGQTTRTEVLEFTCPKCARLIELRWPAEYEQRLSEANLDGFN